MKTLFFRFSEIKNLTIIFVSLAATLVYGAFLFGNFLPVIDKVVLGNVFEFLPREVTIRHFSPVLEIFSFFLLFFATIFSLTQAYLVYCGEKKEEDGDDRLEEKGGLIIAGVLLVVGLSFLPNIIFALLFFGIFLLFLSFTDRIYMLTAYLGIIFLILGLILIGSMTISLILCFGTLLLFRPIPIGQWLAIFGFIVVALCVALIGAGAMIFI